MEILKSDEIKKFEELFGKWKSAYEWAVFSYIAIKTSSGLQLLFGRIILEIGRTQEKPPFRVETSHLIAENLQMNLEQGAIESVVADFKKGLLGIPSHVSVPLFVDEVSHVSTYFHEIYHPFITEGPVLPSLQFKGGRKYMIVGNGGDTRRLDWELKA